MKILHALEHSLPRIAGYTIRSRYILESQQECGLEPVVITSPLQGECERRLPDYEKINGIRHYRTGIYNRLDMGRPFPIRLYRRFQYTLAYTKAIEKVCGIEVPDIIHAHSSYLNGHRANRVGRKLGIPTVYEMRGLWADTAAVNQGLSSRSMKYRFINYMDLAAARGATAVVVISDLLRDDLIERGIPPGKIRVVPNGIDTVRFKRQEKDPWLVRRYGLNGKKVVGFIGSLRKIEGIDLLLEVLSRLGNEKKVVAMIIGDGDYLPGLQRRTVRMGLKDRVIFIGSIPHTGIYRYYALIDIFVYPRIDSRVNQRVTPLKPLEAMSMQKAVVASDVGGLRELIRDGETGVLFKAESRDDLHSKLSVLLEHQETVETLGLQARKWVVSERDWRSVTRRYLELYRNILNLPSPVRL